MTQARNVLVFGCRGQVGSSLVEILSGARPCETVDGSDDDPGLSYRVSGVEIEDLDLTDTDAIAGFIERHDPSWVINCSAHTAVDLAESQQQLSRQLNRDAPAAMAAACASLDARFVHYSTDYVFDGSGTEPYLETDPVCPVSVYGVTKASGEEAVLAALPESIILRTAWVYSPKGKNFVNTMLNLASQRDEINVVDDQVGSPTLASDLARVTANIMCSIDGGRAIHQGGVFHATGQGCVSWYGFCREIFRISGIEQVKVNPITTDQYPTPAPRPAYSVLSNERLRQTYGEILPRWQDSLKRCLDMRG